MSKTIGLYFRGMNQDEINALRGRLNALAAEFGHYASAGPTAGEGNLAGLLKAIDEGKFILVPVYEQTEPDDVRRIRREVIEDNIVESGDTEGYHMTKSNISHGCAVWLKQKGESVGFRCEVCNKPTWKPICPECERKREESEEDMMNGDDLSDALRQSINEQRDQLRQIVGESLERAGEGGETGKCERCSREFPKTALLAGSLRTLCLDCYDIEESQI